MSHRPLPIARVLLPLAGAAALLAPAIAHAGRAQAGSTIGLYSTWDLDSGATAGQGVRDGITVQTVKESGDPSAANVQVYDGRTSAAVRLDSVGVLRVPGAPGLDFSGHKDVVSDRAAGQLRLSASTTVAGYDAGPYRRQAWVSGHSWAEVVEGFEVRYAADRADPVTVTLRLTIDGTVTGNDGSGNGLVNGLQAYAILSNTDQGAGQIPGLSPAVWRTESSAAGQVLTITGTLLNPNCPSGKDHCDNFVRLYAGIDLASRALATGNIQFTPTGAPFSADFSVQMALDFSPGVTVWQLDEHGEHEALHAWVNRTAPVPEPATWATLLAGLAGVGALAGRSGRRTATGR